MENLTLGTFPLPKYANTIIDQRNQRLRQVG